MALNAAETLGDIESEDLGTLLLRDLKQIFEEADNPKAMTSAELCEK